MIILQSPKVIATLTIMIITTTIIIIITTKIRVITTINNIDFTRISHHLVLHSKSARACVHVLTILNFVLITNFFWRIILISYKSLFIKVLLEFTVSNLL